MKSLYAESYSCAKLGNVNTFCEMWFEGLITINELRENESATIICFCALFCLFGFNVITDHDKYS